MFSDLELLFFMSYIRAWLVNSNIEVKLNKRNIKDKFCNYLLPLCIMKSMNFDIMYKIKTIYDDYSKYLLK